MEGGLGSTRSGDSAVQPALKCLSWTDAFQSETIRVSGNGPRCAEAFKPLPTAVTPGGGGLLSAESGFKLVLGVRKSPWAVLGRS